MLRQNCVWHKRNLKFGSNLTLEPGCHLQVKDLSVPVDNHDVISVEPGLVLQQLHGCASEVTELSLVQGGEEIQGDGLEIEVQ